MSASGKPGNVRRDRPNRGSEGLIDEVKPRTGFSTNLGLACKRNSRPVDWTADCVEGDRAAIQVGEVEKSRRRQVLRTD